MKRLAASLVAAAALLGFTLAGTALGQDTNAQGAMAAPQVFNAQQGWGDQGNQDRYRGDNQDSQDPYQGDNQDRYQGNDQEPNRGNDPGWDRSGRGWGSGSGRGNGYGWGSDRGRFNRENLEGRWVADDRATDSRGDRRGFRGRGPMRDVLLPDFIRIDQGPNMVRITDSRNNPLQRIMLGGTFGSRSGDRPDYLPGRWRASTLVVDRAMPRGSTITQTFALENRGRTLVVRTHREGFGPRTVEITSTYHRA